MTNQDEIRAQKITLENMRQKKKIALVIAIVTALWSSFTVLQLSFKGYGQIFPLPLYLVLLTATSWLSGWYIQLYLRRRELHRFTQETFDIYNGEHDAA